MATLGLWIAAFAVALAIDFSYCKWLMYLTRKNRLQACMWSAVFPLLSFASFLVCYDSYSYSAVIPACLGSAAGTWLSMRNL